MLRLATVIGYIEILLEAPRGAPTSSTLPPRGGDGVAGSLVRPKGLVDEQVAAVKQSVEAAKRMSFVEQREQQVEQQ